MSLSKPQLIRAYPRLYAALGAISLITITTAVLRRYWRAKEKTRWIDALPGPPGIPIFGNMFQLEKLNYLPQQLEQWAWEYGPLYKIKVGQRVVVIISDPSIVQQQLKDRPHRLTRQPAVITVFKELKMHGLFSNEGEEWKLSRQWIAPVFSPGKVAKGKHMMTHHALLLRERFVEHARVHQATFDKWFPSDGAARVLYNPKEMPSLWEEIGERALAIMINFAFAHGKEDFISLKLIERLKSVFLSVNERVQSNFPTWRFYHTKQDRENLKTIEVLHEAVDQIIESLQKEQQDERKDERMHTLLESLLYEKAGEQEEDEENRILARSAEKASRLTLDQIKGNLLQVIIAGYETTANTTNNILHLLATQSSAQARFHAEVDSVLGSLAQSTSVDDLGPILQQDLTTLFPYTYAIVRESIRLHPASSFMATFTKEDWEIRGHVLPPGSLSILLVRTAALRRCPTPQPFEFRPERWIEAGENERKIMSLDSSGF
ncbi:cytochrome P450, partial [Endogone sp. FLAS-F59071]